jgi:hypothetical protein
VHIINLEVEPAGAGEKLRSWGIWYYVDGNPGSESAKSSLHRDHRPVQTEASERETIKALLLKSDTTTEVV